MVAQMQQEFQAVIGKQKCELKTTLRRKKFSASSEKSKFQLNLFDEAELEA